MWSFTHSYFFMFLTISLEFPQHIQKYPLSFKLSSLAMRSNNRHSYQDDIFIRITVVFSFVRKIAEQCLVLTTCPKCPRFIILVFLPLLSEAPFCFSSLVIYTDLFWLLTAWPSCLALTTVLFFSHFLASFLLCCFFSILLHSET